MNRLPDGKRVDNLRRPAPRFQPSPDTVYNRMGDTAVLVDMRTNRIYDLNKTSAQLWELLMTGKDNSEIHEIMSEQYDIEEAQLADEIENCIASLIKDKLVSRVDAG